MNEYPTLSIDDIQDERAPNVFLIYAEPEEKTTAEDCGNVWMLRNWELIDHDDSKVWFDRCGFSIAKTTIAKLAEIQNAPDRF